jgi:hypothetical protein
LDLPSDEVTNLRAAYLQNPLSQWVLLGVRLIIRNLSTTWVDALKRLLSCGSSPNFWLPRDGGFQPDATSF